MLNIKILKMYGKPIKTTNLLAMIGSMDSNNNKIPRII